MVFHLFLYSAFVPIIVSYIINTDEEHHYQQIPFFVMQPHTIINQTLYSYCKEQYEYNFHSTFINLTIWPVGFIYTRNPYQKLDDNFYTNAYLSEACTMELRAPVGDHIRFVFYPMSSMHDDRDQDYYISIPRAPCLKVIDHHETTIFDCPMMLDKNKLISFNHPSEDYLSNSNTIYLELILPPTFMSDYDETYHQFKILFTTFTPKLNVGVTDDHFICPVEHLIDCDDEYCVHADARCNGIYECRSNIDEEYCTNAISSGISIRHMSWFIINIRYFSILIFISMV